MFPLALLMAYADAVHADTIAWLDTVREEDLDAIPDVAAHDDRPCAEPAYGVRFPARELWGDAAAANETIHVDLWESYLEPA